MREKSENNNNNNDRWSFQNLEHHQNSIICSVAHYKQNVIKIRLECFELFCS